MKSSNIVQLISQISSLPQLQPQPHPLLTLKSLTNPKQCTNCLNQTIIITQLSEKIGQISSQYNKLLMYSKRLIDLNYELFEEQQGKFQETVAEFQRDILENQDRIKELEEIVQANSGQFVGFRNLLLEKDQIINQLEDRIDRITKERNVGSPNHQVQVLRHHRREKSQLCNNLQKLNAKAEYENSKLMEENHQLAQKIEQLTEYVRRMEDDLANANIKSPRIIKKLIECPQFPSQDNLNEISRCSINEQSPIAQDDQKSKIIHAQEYRKRTSLSSSFAPSGRVLRDVLNISGQTSNYFNFRTKQKFEQSNAYVIRDNSSENNENDMNLTNVHQTRKDSIPKIMEIKQFQVHDSAETKNRKDSQKSPCIMIDPYYAYFVLTIQCLKMNWRSLDEVANISLIDQWDNLISTQVPINKWGDYLKDLLISKITI